MKVKPQVRGNLEATIMLRDNGTVKVTKGYYSNDVISQVEALTNIDFLATGGYTDFFSLHGADNTLYTVRKDKIEVKKNSPFLAKTKLMWLKTDHTASTGQADVVYIDEWAGSAHSSYLSMDSKGNVVCYYNGRRFDIANVDRVHAGTTYGGWTSKNNSVNALSGSPLWAGAIDGVHTWGAEGDAYLDKGGTVHTTHNGILNNLINVDSLSHGSCHIVAVTKSGSVICQGSNSHGACNTQNWNLYTCSSGLLVAKSPLNFLSATSVNGFDIIGQEPANTKRRLLWKVDNIWNKLAVTNGTAALTRVATQAPTVDSVLNEGNTVQEVQAATSIPPFVGKLVYPAIAMYSAPNAATPTLHLKANAETSTAQYSYTEYSPVYDLVKGTTDTKNVTLVDVSADVTTKGQGNVNIGVSLLNDNVWSDYMPLINAQMKTASAIKFRAIHTVKTVNSADSSHIDNIKVTYTDGDSVVNGASTDIVTRTQKFENKLSYVHAHVKHNKLIDAKIKAYVAVREMPQKRHLIQIGNGSGASQTIKLADSGIDQNSLIVYVNNNQTFDFDYSVETSEITITAEKGAAISASYEYGWNKTEWLEMPRVDTQSTAYGYDTTTFEYAIPSDKDYTVSAVKYTLERPKGKVYMETLGTATGERQIFTIPHEAKKDTFICNFPFTYNDENQTLTVIGDKGKDIVVSYDWIAESPHVYGIMAGWAD